MAYYLCFISRVIFTFSVLFHLPADDAYSQNKGSQKAGKRPNILFVIADDWSYPHASAYGDAVVATPNFDKVAKNGLLFTNAYVVAPSCTPSRAGILTGLYPHRLQEGVNLWGFLPDKFPAYPYLLQKAGYAVGAERKGWGPGNYQAGGYTHNPAGRAVKFTEFFTSLPVDQPFCFWYGSSDPHRPYDTGTGSASGMQAGQVSVPGFLPDIPQIRADIIDYHYEVARFDRDLGLVLNLLDSLGYLDNTVVVVTSDNGMPFPRAKANVVDGGTRVPLAIAWGNQIKGGRRFEGFVNLIDLAPTFLEVAGIEPPLPMDGKSLLPLLKGQVEVHHQEVFLERERHAYVRKGNLSYPVRAIRNKDFLYIRNLKPERWPAGDSVYIAGRNPYGDVDDSPSKEFMIEQKANPKIAPYARLAFAKRPAEELYELGKDPFQLRNVAGDKQYASALQKLRKKVDTWMQETKDPRLDGGGEEIENYPYYNGQGQAIQVEKE